MGLVECESKVQGKFSSAFGKAGSCAGDEMTCEDIADACESSVTGAFVDTFPSTCEAAKRTAAGKLARGELACYAAAAARPLAVNSGCITKATGKFAAAMTKAGTCPDGGSTATLVESACVGPLVTTGETSIVTDICPPPTTTSSTTTSTSTTTTTTICSTATFIGCFFDPVTTRTFPFVP